MAYLGMRVGGGLGRIGIWKEVVEKIRRRLEGWKVKTLSFGGRVTLINSVLAAIPSYHLGLIPIPVGVVKEIRTIQRKFLWGESKDGPKKISWTKWEDICLSKEKGGLGVKNLIWFNGAMLGKWRWRFITESQSLWARVIRSRHRVEEDGGGGVRGSGRGWWGQVLRATDVKFGEWFNNRLVREIGDGMSTKFWSTRWEDGLSLRERYPRLYHLSSKKNGVVGEMGEWEEQEWRWRLDWRREMRGRDEELRRELEEWLSSKKLTQGRHDIWKWGREGKGQYTVKLAYLDISCGAGGRESAERQAAAHFKLLWKVEAQFKSKCAGWRLLRNSLPSKANLHKRLELQPEERKCTCCGHPEEDAQHLMLRCEVAHRLWSAVTNWIGISWAAPEEVTSHFMSFANLVYGKRARKALGALWLCVTWVIWKRRNEVVFQESTWEFRRLLEEIRCRFWSWCSARRCIDGDGSYLEWTKSPLYDFLSKL